LITPFLQRPPDLDGDGVTAAVRVGVAAEVGDGVAPELGDGVAPEFGDGVAPELCDGVAADVGVGVTAGTTVIGAENSLVNICRPPAVEVAVAVRRLPVAQVPTGMVNAKGVGLVAPVTTREVPM